MVSKVYNVRGGGREEPSNWAKYKLLMWKNWTIGFRNKWGLLKDISTPIIFSVMILLTRYFVEPETLPVDLTYPQMRVNNMPILQAPDSRLTVSNWDLAFSPSGIEVTEFMDVVAENLNLTLRGFPSRSALSDYLSTQAHYPFVVVQFDDSLTGNTSLPDHLQYDIRFPSMRRLGSGNWNTDRIRRSISPSVLWGPQDPQAYSPYFTEGFLAVQNVISMTFIQLNMRETVSDLPEFFIQRQPFPASRMDFAVNLMGDLLSAVLIISFLPSCMNMTKMLATEKEKQLKDIMKIMGLPNWLHWSSWFSKFFIQMLIVVSFMMAIFKIPMHGGVSIFTESNWLPVWLFLFVYAISVIMFSFLISVLIKSPSSASLLAGVAMFIIYVPYFIILNLGADLYVAEIMGLSLFNSLGMAFGFNFILKLEDRRVGLQWHNLFEPLEFANGVSVGDVLIMLIVSSCVYFILALYIEKIMPGNYGIPEKWYFPVDPKYWFGCLRVSSGGEAYADAEQADVKMEHASKCKKVGISMRRLRKVYSTGKVAVHGLKMNLYEDEITVLLGHNGAGKTTTISMLTGMIPATSGTAYINGYDVNTEMAHIRGQMGICPQHNILFDELTVEEHILFYSKLKGLSNKKALGEVNKYVKKLQLLPKISAQSHTLSGGMKRKLCIGIALCGESKFILLDEPTAGMDPTARRALWDLLQMEKKSRTIILSTHFMDEADVLGDRIAIMHEGRLKCYGSSHFLKKEFGEGYSLTFEKSKLCKVSEVTRILEQFIPNIEMTANVGTELSFRLPEKNAVAFEPMLRQVEEQSLKLGILGYGISVTTLEEVFLSVGSDTKTILAVPSDDDTTMDSETGSTISILDPPELLRGRALRQSQWLAMFMKIYFYSIRNYVITILKIITPTIFVLLTIIAARAFARVTKLPAIPIDLSLYEFRTETVMQRNFTDGSPWIISAMDNYRMQIEDSKFEHRVQSTDENIVSNLLRIGRHGFAEFTRNYVISATFAETQIVALFSNQYHHTPAVTLQHTYNALLKAVAGDRFSISVRNYPLPFTTGESINFSDNHEDIGFQIMLNMGCGMVIVMALYILFYIKENASKAKLLQFVSGVQVWTFWISTIIADLFIYLVSIALMSSILTAFDNPGWENGADIGRTYALFACFGFATMPFIYLFSMANKDSANGFNNISMIGFGMIIIFVLNRQLRLDIVDMEELARGMDWVFMMVPYYNLAHALFHINKMNAILNNCNTLCAITQNCTESISVCDIHNECCNLDYFKWASPGIGRNLTFLLLMGIILFIFLFLKEFGHLKALYYKLFQSGEHNAVSEIPQISLDSDVQAEKDRVRNMSLDQIRESNMVMQDLVKVYKKFPAVKGVSVAVKESECFGLLGVNGAGKTSTFKMMTGDEVITYGDAWIKGHPLKGEINQVYSQIGYCPQFNAMLEDMTGRETMTIFCLLRGVPRNRIPNFIFRLARELNFMQHLDKRIHQYSGGNKRKLSTALALIGNPSVIFLDEPTAGMDPGAKRNLWDVVSRVRDMGKTVILTSHSMEECEALCTRITIMVNGEFKCLGSLQYLKNKFSKGFVLTVQVMRSNDGAEKEVCKEDIKTVHDYVMEHLPGAQLKEDYQGRVTYYINNTKLKWSSMFGIMETAKQTLRIENYSLTQTTLEQIFLDFAQHQNS